MRSNLTGIAAYGPKWIKSLSLVMLVLGGSAGTAGTPALPDRPALETAEYPNCQQAYIAIMKRADKYLSVKSCIMQIERFNQFSLRRFPSRIKAYVETIVLLERGYSKTSATVDEKMAFQRLVRTEIEKCRSISSAGEYGDYYRDYYNYFARYKDDLTLLVPLRERFRTTQGA